MKDIKEKKLLVISSDSSDIGFVEAAHELGAYVICCDRYLDWNQSPAKKLADEAWNIDYKEFDKIAKLCKEKGIDGVIAGYNEEKVMSACKIASLINTPFYATEEQIQITRDKLYFKRLCEQYGIETPKEYSNLLPFSDDSKKQFEYPLIVKPADSYGRKGISICDDEVQLVTAIELAQLNSNNNEILIEQYLTGIELSAVYTLVDGEVSLSCLNDKYISQHENGRSKLCDLVLTPSSFYSRYLEEVDEKVKNLLHGIGAKNGVANFQFIANNTGIRAFEMGYRVNGNEDFKVIRKYNNIDFMKMLISHSLTGEMGDCLSKDNPNFPQFSTTLVLHVADGVIGKIEYDGLEKIKEIDDITLKKSVGAHILKNGTNQQKAMMIKMSADTIPEIIQLITHVQKIVKIEDINGKNMLLPAFDVNRLRERYDI